MPSGSSEAEPSLRKFGETEFAPLGSGEAEPSLRESGEAEFVPSGSGEVESVPLGSSETDPTPYAIGRISVLGALIPLGRASAICGSRAEAAGGAGHKGATGGRCP